MALFSWRALEDYKLRKKKPKRKIEYPLVEPGELFTVQLPQGQQFLKDFEKNKIRGMLFLGSTGSGKSSSLEDLAEFFIRKGEVVVDLHSAYWEGVFWARKYPVILVQAPSKYQVKSDNPKITVHTWHEGFNWAQVMKEAREKKAVLVSSCWLPDVSYYIMLREFIEALLNPLNAFPRVIVIRDLVSLLPSGLKESSAKELVELKRKMLLFVRQGRKVGNRILADTQIAEDILRSFRENVWVKVYKYYEGRIQGLDEDLNNEINWLNEKQALIHYKGVWFGATFPLNECHKNEKDALSDLKLRVEEFEEMNIEENWSKMSLPPIEGIEKIVEETALPEGEKEAWEGYLSNYQVLRAIARDEYLKAGVPETSVDIMVEKDFPSDPKAKSITWREIKDILELRIQSDSARKLYQTHKHKINNNVVEMIGLRFIKHLVAQTPDFPTQTFFNRYAGSRDVEFRAGGRLVASGNVKLFRDDHPRRMVHLSPEYRDPVHYALVVKVKPFRLTVFRGTGEEYVAEGSVSDLGWRGFVENLRLETDKVKRDVGIK
ncbi:MAG: hypothetical protein ACTSQY_05835 [Candidatus Odinarchaeia archaeon]